MFVMNVYIMIFFICDTLAYYKNNRELISPNVGTVLFTRSDLNKKYWSKDKIKLLQARKHFQGLIPYPHPFGTVNDDYLNMLLSYFKESYSTVKREIKNSEINNMMNTALSDAIGGYFKVWVLPVTKFAYYGGTISSEKAINVFKVFEDIKRNLNTDGRSWPNPTEKLLKSVEINVVPRSPETIIRSMNNPCKHLAYYEKTGTDLSIPLPVINWNINPVTIFVPLKNQTLEPISSVNSSNILVNFYGIADKCMQAHSVASSDNFKNKFQTWLTNYVTPHLNDDKLYLAFGNILTLVNDTNKVYGKVIKNCNDEYEKIKIPPEIESSLQEFPKQYLIIAIILLVELIWCLPSLYYVLRLKKNNRQRRIKDKCFKFFKRKRRNWNIFSYYTHREKLRSNFLDENIQENGVQLVIKPREKKLPSEVQYPSCKPKYVPVKNSKSYYKGMFSEQPHANVFPKKSSLKKTLPEFVNIETDHLINKHNKPNDNQKLSKITQKPKAIPRDLDKTRTLIDLQDEQTINEINYSQESTLKLSDSKCKCCCTGRSSKKLLNQSSCNHNTSVITDNIHKEKSSNMHPKTKLTLEKNKIKENKPLTQQTMMHTDVHEKAQSHRQIIDKNEIKRDSSMSSKAKNSKPLLRIRIERPRKETAIRVGITSIRENSNNKPSKIPRLAVKRETKESNLFKKEATTSLRNTERSKVTKIILRKKNHVGSTLDDTAIKRTSTVERKLNETV